MDACGRASTTFSSNVCGARSSTNLIYPGDFQSGLDLFPALENYFRFYNQQRPHQALGYQTPADLFPHRPKRKSGGAHDGDPVPQTSGIYRFCFPEWIPFRFTRNRARRTTDLLARRIGLRRDATRSADASPEWTGGLRAASLLSSPPLYLRTAVFLSNQPDHLMHPSPTKVRQACVQEKPLAGARAGIQLRSFRLRRGPVQALAVFLQCDEKWRTGRERCFFQKLIRNSVANRSALSLYPYAHSSTHSASSACPACNLSAPSQFSISIFSRRTRLSRSYIGSGLTPRVKRWSLLQDLAHASRISLLAMMVILRKRAPTK